MIMAKVRFYILSKHEGQPATVYLRYSDGRKMDIWTSMEKSDILTTLDRF